ncbi:RhoGEF domain [Carpediemonas membranifera]|uniref:RhoGEF domain n=1 Tax=Carpediemonas membranifera TaxID=201153 RepID=A0A8J6AWZ7_9EUKA|nr:RhoGEF domain [Carpediemonas membranifera]|eukprot:KAG9394595.1 RhoGEF domain [Carpediemonas membranifera]
MTRRPRRLCNKRSSMNQPPDTMELELSSIIGDCIPDNPIVTAFVDPNVSVALDGAVRVYAQCSSLHFLEIGSPISTFKYILHRCPLDFIYRATILGDLTSGELFALDQQSRRFHSFSFRTRQWKALADMPTGKLRGFAMTAADGFVYVHGGSGPDVSDALHVYNVAEDCWETHRSFFEAEAHTGVGRYLLYRRQLRRIHLGRFDVLPDCPIETEGAQVVQTKTGLTVLAGSRVASFNTTTDRWGGICSCELRSVLGTAADKTLLMGPTGRVWDVSWLVHVAIKPDLAALLTDVGIDPLSIDVLTDTDVRGRTVLHIAAAHAPEMLTPLLVAGCDPNSVDQGRLPPLADAVQSGNVDATKTLLDAGADFKLALDRLPRADTPSHALLRRARQLARVLDYPAFNGLIHARGFDTTSPTILTDKNKDGHTILHVACDECINAIPQLLRAGADPSLIDLTASEYPVEVVELIKTAVTDRKREKRLAHRSRVVHELRDTERTYVTAMNFLRTAVIPEFIRRSTAEDWPKTLANPATIFANLSQFIPANIDLLNRLEERLASFDPEKTLVGDIFVLIGPYINMYKHYSSNYDAAQKKLQAPNTKSALASFLEWVRSHDSNPTHLDLLSYLIMPVQRVPRYKMQLAELIKSTESDHPDMQNLEDALKIMSDVANTVNAHMSEQDRRVAVQGIRTAISNWNEIGGDVSGYDRQLFKRGQLSRLAHRAGTWKGREFVLLSDVFMYLSRGRLSVDKGCIPLCAAFVSAGEDNIFVVRAPGRVFELRAATAAERDSWVTAISQRIDEITALKPGLRQLRAELEDMARDARETTLLACNPLSPDWGQILRDIRDDIWRQMALDAFKTFQTNIPDQAISISRFAEDSTFRIGSMVVSVTATSLSLLDCDPEVPARYEFRLEAESEFPLLAVARACCFKDRVYALNDDCAMFYAFDLTKRVWLKLADMPTGKLRGFAMTAADGFVYVHGGSGPDVSDALHVYNVAEDCWETHRSFFEAEAHTGVGRYLLYRRQLRRIHLGRFDVLPDCPIETEGAQVVQTKTGLTVLAGSRVASFNASLRKWTDIAPCDPDAVLAVKDGVAVTVTPPATYRAVQWRPLEPTESAPPTPHVVLDSPVDLMFVIDKGFDLEARDEHQETALVTAVKQGKPYPVKLLLEAGADLSNTREVVKNPEIAMLLDEAHALRSIRRDEAFVALLQANGIDPGSPDLAESSAVDGWTAMHYAVWRPSVIPLLLRIGMNVNAADRHGLSPLAVAVTIRKVDAVNALIENGANPNLVPEETLEGRIEAALMVRQAQSVWAIRHGPEFAPFRVILRDAGFDTTDQALIVTQNDNGDSVLHIACVQYPDAIQTLIDAGALDVENINEQKTPLELAVEYDHWYGVLGLLMAGATPLNARNPTPKGHRSGELLRQVRRYAEAARRLHSTRPDVKELKAMCFDNDETALRLKQTQALWYCRRDAEFTALCHFNKLKPRSPSFMSDLDAHGRAPIHLAAQHLPAMVPVLLMAGAELDARDGNGFTPLFLACRYHPSLVSVLAAMGADVNAVTAKGVSLLHFAVRIQPKLIRTLVSAGADLERESDLTRMTALEIAARFQPKAVPTLLDLGADPRTVTNRALGETDPKASLLIERAKEDRESSGVGGVVRSLVKRGLRR